jgi:hypothetical protein
MYRNINVIHILPWKISNIYFIVAKYIIILTILNTKTFFRWKAEILMAAQILVQIDICQFWQKTTYLVRNEYLFSRKNSVSHNLNDFHQRYLY